LLQIEATFACNDRRIPSAEIANNLENVMKLFAVLLLVTVAGAVPALAQTSASAPAGTPEPNKPPRKDRPRQPRLPIRPRRRATGGRVPAISRWAPLATTRWDTNSQNTNRQDTQRPDANGSDAKSRRHFRAAAGRVRKLIADEILSQPRSANLETCWAERKSKCVVPEQEHQLSCGSATAKLSYPSSPARVRRFP
jgi:hypothetical protein